MTAYYLCTDYINIITLYVWSETDVVRIMYIIVENNYQLIERLGFVLIEWDAFISLQQFINIGIGFKQMFIESWLLPVIFLTLGRQ